MDRKETYCTTGTRPVVRVFGGWDFTAKDLEKPDFAWVGRVTPVVSRWAAT